jgi:MOSC domain-containing protein YiiM
VLAGNEVAMTVESPLMLVSLQVGLTRMHGHADAAEAMDREWTSGFYKSPVSGPVWLGTTNLAGDGQADLENHGGPDKAVNAYPSEHYPGWREELQLDVLPFGAFGENFTLGGLTETTIAIGDVFEVGGAIVQVSQPRQPCWKLARRWRIKDLAARVIQTGRTGWYFRVLQGGYVAAADALQRIERPHPEWTIAAANDVMYHRREDRDVTAALSECPALSASWRAALRKRLSKVAS